MLLKALCTFWYLLPALTTKKTCLPVRQVLRPMRLTAIILLATALQVSARSIGQTITLSMKDAPLEKVFKEIQKQSGYAFVYFNDDLTGTKKVDVQVKAATLDVVLQLCLQGQPLTYSVANKIVVIKKGATISIIKSNGSPPIDVHGVVKDEKGNVRAGVTITIKGSKNATSTDDNGEFILKNIDPDATLVFSSVGTETYEVKVNGQTDFTISLKTKIAALSPILVQVNTGYQQISKERATGSFVHLNNEIISRTVSTNILDRLVGMSLGLNGKYQQAPLGLSYDPVNSRHLFLTVRGVSTLSSAVGTDPLVVLDNFPYEGDLNNINPNDIESVTILKDAAAASIWGARAGNGVIVLTTQKGSFNRRMEISLNSSVSVMDKPALRDNPFFISASHYIEIERTLFNRNYYNASINNRTSWPFLSPVIEILTRQRAGQISAAEADAQIALLKENDIRDDQLKYVYQRAVNVQNSIGIRGGTDKLTYSLSVGYDNNKSTLVRNGFNRTTINTVNVYKPVKNLEITTTLNYSRSESMLNNNIVLYRYPYDKFADAFGNPLPTYGAYRAPYIDSLQRLGFQNWQYFPLEELNNADNKITTSDLLTRIGVKYRIIPAVSIEMNYQNETQHIINRNYQNVNTFSVRDLVNQFTQYNATTHTFTYKVPLGGILNLTNTDYNADNYRAQLDFNKKFTALHEVTAIAGAEIRQLKTSSYSGISYGYDNETGTANNALDFYNPLPKYPTGSGTIPFRVGSVRGVTLRYISYFVNAAYTYHQRYTVSVSGRKDGSNIFGVNSNDRVTPLWSSGAAWDISQEKFYHSGFLPYLKLRATYGYNGNVYNGTAYVTGYYTSTSLTGAQTIGGLTPPNPDLKWERVRTVNFGVDFSVKKNIISGSVEIYQKDGLDLIETLPLAGSTGFTSFTGNAASTRTRGLELLLNSKNLDGPLTWNTTFLFNSLRDKITRYDIERTSGSIQSAGGVVGKPVNSIYSYRWAGLDPVNGDPQGYSNGKISKDYSGIINNYNPDSLVFHGSTSPTVFGSLRNDLGFKGFTLSFNIIYKLGYYFRRYSTSLNYTDIVNSGLSSFSINSDYAKRWQNPGDEGYTNVPSVLYPSNSVRNTFYQYSSVLVTRGDHIRLQDIRLDYDIKNVFAKNLFKSFRIYCLLSNVGVLWRANKFDVDPDAYSPSFGVNPAPLTINLGLNATF